MISSCATIFTGSKSKVTFTSNVDKADKFYVDGIPYSNVSFPYTTKIKKGFQSTLIKAESKDLDPVTIEIDKKFNAVSVLNMFGIIGWGIDAATGAMMKSEYKGYEILFKKEE